MTPASPWLHHICTECMVRERPGSVRELHDSPPARCCWCGHDTTSGLQIRNDPKPLICGGHHPEPEASP